MHQVDKPGLLRLILSSTKYKMFNFMASLIVLLILSAVLEGTKYGYLILNIASTIVFISGVYAAGRNKMPGQHFMSLYSILLLTIITTKALFFLRL